MTKEIIYPIIYDVATMNEAEVLPDSSGEEWEDIPNITDGNMDTCGSISVKVSNYMERTLNMAIDFSGIKGTITDVNLTVSAKQNSSNLSRTITILVDANGDTSKRVMSEDINTTLRSFNADLTKYANTLSSLVLIPSINSSSSTILYVYEIRLDVAYTPEGSQDQETLSMIYLGGNSIANMYYGSKPITEVYLGNKLIYSLGK